MNFGPFDALIQAWMTLTDPVETGLLVVFGLLAGGLVNHVISTWCWFPRPISPWLHLASWKFEGTQREIAQTLPARTWADRIPVFGWWRLRRESSLHGRGFWIRPILIELGLALALPWMLNAYQSGWLLPLGTHEDVVAACAGWMTLVFFFHAILLILMTAATFIDFDERTIPDTITIPGTLFALSIASLTPYVFMPGELPEAISPVTLQHPLQLAPWWMSGRGLAVGLSIWSVWCFALADRRLIFRRGLAKAIDYFIARLFRHPSWKLLAAIWAAGSIAISVVYTIGNVHWLGLISSLLGLAIGGGIVWAIRLVGGWAMQMEAMGFGDVTLMAMIGSFLGWQASIAAFFLRANGSDRHRLDSIRDHARSQLPVWTVSLPGTLLTVLSWDSVYNANFRITIATMGDMLSWLSLVMLGLLGAMLWVWRLIKQRLFA